MGVVLYVAASLYGLNMLVGLAAQFLHVRWGVWHHVLYALVCISAAVALIWSFQWGLIVTGIALAAFPWARPGRRLHPTLAIVGAGGYVAAFVAMMIPV